MHMRTLGALSQYASEDPGSSTRDCRSSDVYAFEDSVPSCICIWLTLTLSWHICQGFSDAVHTVKMNISNMHLMTNLGSLAAYAFEDPVPCCICIWGPTYMHLRTYSGPQMHILTLNLSLRNSVVILQLHQMYYLTTADYLNIYLKLTDLNWIQFNISIYNIS